MIQDGENSTPFKATEFVDGYKYKIWITDYAGTQNISENGPFVCHSSMIFHLKFLSISPLMLLGLGECTNFQCVCANSGVTTRVINRNNFLSFMLGSLSSCNV